VSVRLFPENVAACTLGVGLAILSASNVLSATPEWDCLCGGSGLGVLMVYFPPAWFGSLIKYATIIWTKTTANEAVEALPEVPACTNIWQAAPVGSALHHGSQI
jgi:hypothetical protein